MEQGWQGNFSSHRNEESGGHLSLTGQGLDASPRDRCSKICLAGGIGPSLGSSHFLCWVQSGETWGHRAEDKQIQTQIHTDTDTVNLILTLEELY